MLYIFVGLLYKLSMLDLSKKIVPKMHRWCFISSEFIYAFVPNKPKVKHDHVLCFILNLAEKISLVKNVNEKTFFSSVLFIPCPLSN